MDGFERAERAGICGGGNEDVAILRMAVEEFGDDFAAAISHAPAVDADEGFDGEVRQLVANALEGSGDAALHQRAGFFNIKPENPINFLLPAFDGLRGKQLAGFDAHAVVIDAEVGGMRVGNVEGDERDAGIGDFVGNDGRGLLIDLEFDDEIDVVADEFLGNTDGGGAVVAVVEHDEIDARLIRRSLQAGGHGLRKRHLAALLGEAKTHLARAADKTIKPVLRLREVAAMHKRFEDAIDGGFGDAGALVDGFERHGLIFLLNQLKDVEGFGQDRNEVETFRRGLRQSGGSSGASLNEFLIGIQAKSVSA